MSQIRDAIADADLGDPLATSAYSLCLHDDQADGSRLLFAARVPAGGTCGPRPCWQRTSKRVSFRDATGIHDGLTKITGNPARGTLQLVGSGPHLATSTLPLPVPLTAEIRVEGGACWQVPIAPADIRRNDAARFDAAIK